MGLWGASLAWKGSSVVKLGISPSTGWRFRPILDDFGRVWNEKIESAARSARFSPTNGRFESKMDVFTAKMGVFRAKMARFPRKARNRETDKKS